MSDQKKPKLEQLTTPAGIAKYPRLNKPETEIDGKPLETPRFKVSLILNEADKGVTELKEQLEKLHAATVAKAEKEHAAKQKTNPKLKGKPLTVNPVIVPVLDEEGNEVEGQFQITAKTQAVTQDGTPKKMKMFDAKGKPCAKNPNIGGGSKLKLSLSLSPYNGNMGAGVSLYLNAVQVIELEEYVGGGNASSYGFGQEEGYSSDEEQGEEGVGSSRVDLQACKLEYSIVSPK